MLQSPLSWDLSTLPDEILSLISEYFITDFQTLVALAHVSPSFRTLLLTSGAETESSHPLFSVFTSRVLNSLGSFLFSTRNGQGRSCFQSIDSVESLLECMSRRQTEIEWSLCLFQIRSFLRFFVSSIGGHLGCLVTVLLCLLSFVVFRDLGNPVAIHLVFLPAFVHSCIACLLVWSEAVLICFALRLARYHEIPFAHARVHRAQAVVDVATGTSFVLLTLLFVYIAVPILGMSSSVSEPCCPWWWWSIFAAVIRVILLTAIVLFGIKWAVQSAHQFWAWCERQVLEIRRKRRVERGGDDEAWEYGYGYGGVDGGRYSDEMWMYQFRRKLWYRLLEGAFWGLCGVYVCLGGVLVGVLLLGREEWVSESFRGRVALFTFPIVLARGVSSYLEVRSLMSRGQKEPLATLRIYAWFVLEIGIGIFGTSLIWFERPWLVIASSVMLTALSGLVVLEFLRLWSCDLDASERFWWRSSMVRQKRGLAILRNRKYPTIYPIDSSLVPFVEEE